MKAPSAPPPRTAAPLRTLLLCAVAALWALAGCVPSAPPLEQTTTTFDRPLPIPPLAESRLVDGTRTFSLDAREGSSELVAGLETPTWGFNGPVLGPTLRAQAGERVAVEMANNVPEPTTVHWHGMHLPAEMDGGPHQPVDPGSISRWTRAASGVPAGR